MGEVAHRSFGCFNRRLFDFGSLVRVNRSALMKKSTTPKYRRILLKLSGEALGDEKGTGINPEAIHAMALQVGAVRKMGVDVVIVVGGGNIFRGLQGSERGIE